MSQITQQAINMMEMLPETEQNLALELIKRLVLAWDPDYTRLTPAERKKLEAAENGEYLDLNKINWENISEEEPDEWDKEMLKEIEIRLDIGVTNILF